MGSWEDDLTYETPTGEVVTLDRADYDLLDNRSITMNGLGYPQVQHGGRNVTLHRAIMGEAPEGMTVDHVDRNPLNARRSNLRFATWSEQCINTKDRDRVHKLPRGVYRNHNRFIGRVTRDRKVHHLGNFETPEAAEAAVLAFKESHGR